MSIFGPNQNDPLSFLNGDTQPVPGTPDQLRERYATPIEQGSVASPTINNGFNQFSVEEFKSKFLAVGLVTPSNFLVKFTPPLSIFDKPEDAKQFEDVPFLCGATKLPGMRIATTSLRRYNYGNVIKMPYDTMTDDIELIFYVDATRAQALGLFHTWMRSIIDIGRDFPGKKTNLVSYRNDYICDKLSIFIVSQLAGLENPTEMPDPNGSNGETSQTSPNGANPPAELSTGNYAIVECTLHEVFPIQIGDISLDWGEADNFARVSVTFSYRTHEFKFGEFTKKSLGFRTGYSYQPVSSTNTSVTQDPEEKDFLTSVTQFLGKIADTKRKIQQFQTNWKTFQNAKGGLGKLTALGNLAGPGSSLNTTANQLNQIVSMTNFITGNGVAKARSGTKKTTSTLP